MDRFEQRERAFEAAFQHDQELAFKVHIRKIRLYGAWIAEQMKLPEAERAAYVQSLIDADFAARGQADLIGHTHATLAERKIDISTHRLAKEIEHCAQEAKRQIATEMPQG